MCSKFLIILIALHFTSGSIFDGLFSAQSIAKQDFDKQIKNSTELNIVFEFPNDKAFKTFDLIFKQQLVHNFGSIINQLIDELIDVSQQSIEALLQFKYLVKYHAQIKNRRFILFSLLVEPNVQQFERFKQDQSK